MSYGLNSKMVEDAFAKEYVICNMGVIGGTTATFQFDCITHYLKEDDVFIHAPEQLSPYQLFRNIGAESRIFVTTEANYDLLSLCDMSLTDGLFDFFTNYNEIRSTLEECSYSDYNPNYNQYGDYAVYRENSKGSEQLDEFPSFDLTIVDETSLSNMQKYYDKITAKGAKLFLSFAPNNVNSLSSEDMSTSIWTQYANSLKYGLNVTVISDIFDYIMEGKYFYDTDYHLSTEGANVRTEMLIRDIKQTL